jgi:hypothetical protein
MGQSHQIEAELMRKPSNDLSLAHWGRVSLKAPLPVSQNTQKEKIASNPTLALNHLLWSKISVNM